MFVNPNSRDETGPGLLPDWQSVAIQARTISATPSILIATMIATIARRACFCTWHLLLLLLLLLVLLLHLPGWERPLSRP